MKKLVGTIDSVTEFAKTDWIYEVKADTNRLTILSKANLNLKEGDKVSFEVKDRPKETTVKRQRA